MFSASLHLLALVSSLCGKVSPSARGIFCRGYSHCLNDRPAPMDPCAATCLTMIKFGRRGFVLPHVAPREAELKLADGMTKTSAVWSSRVSPHVRESCSPFLVSCGTQPLSAEAGTRSGEGRRFLKSLGPSVHVAHLYSVASTTSALKHLNF